MQHAPLGSSQVPASRVALGAWAIGGWMWGGQQEADSIAAIHASLDAGVTLIDTAPMYGMGASERIVGKALAQLPPAARAKAVIATKVGMRWDLDEPRGRPFFRTDDDAINPEGDKQVYIYNGPKSVRLEVERSLQRLAVDTIDLIQTHWQDGVTPIADTAGELLRLRDEGKVRAIGACNASLDQLAEYRAAGALDTDQERYSMIDRDADAQRLPWCRERHVAVLAYSPLANGLLTGKVPPDRVFPPDDLRSQRPRFSVANRRKVAALLDAIRPIADAHRLTLAQLAVAWSLAQPGMSHALVGARSPQQAAENAAAADASLTPDDLAAIDAALHQHAAHLDSAALPQPKST